MNNTESSDLFNNFEIPAFDAGTKTVPAQMVSETKVPAKNDFNNSLTTYIGIGLITIVLLIVFIVLLTKKTQKPIQEEQEETVEKNIEIPQQNKVIEIKTKKKTSSLATPTNIKQCIKLFLENTRTKS